MQRLELKEVNSTNLYCKENMAFLQDKTIVTAKKQTSGRGRFDRAWIDFGEENLFLSLVLKGSDGFLPVYSNLTQYMSVVLCHVLENYGLKPEIKWPNDVLIDGKKIAGILCETVMRGHEFKGLVLGIGVNLKANSEAVLQITDKKVTAVNLELNCEIDKEIFLNELLEEFFGRYDEFLKKGFHFVKTDYLRYANFLDKEVRVKVLSEIKSGLVKAVDNDGALVLENNGEEFILTMGDIIM